MRCLACNAEMLLMEAVPADPTTLPGFEHHTFLCSACNRIERRLLFIGVKTKWTRAVEKLVRKQKALKEEQTLASKSSDQASAVETSRRNLHQHPRRNKLFPARPATFARVSQGD
jgi:hypothetical protein